MRSAAARPVRHHPAQRSLRWARLRLVVMTPRLRRWCRSPPRPLSIETRSRSPFPKWRSGGPITSSRGSAGRLSKSAPPRSSCCATGFSSSRKISPRNSSLPRRAPPTGPPLRDRRRACSPPRSSTGSSSDVDYKASGVDIDAGNETVRRIRALARSTFTPGVLSDIGSFGGLFQLEPGKFHEPVLVSSADGVGTKLKLAFLTNRHDTVGVDLVNHCVNDVLVQGAEPLFFLDYLATGRLSPNVAQSIIEGIASACRDNGCALLGGETAEMPGFYPEGEYDLAGFVVGVVDRARLITGRTIAVGDLLIGVPSSGLHTNGYSLARRIVFDRLKLQVDSYRS